MRATFPSEHLMVLRLSISALAGISLFVPHDVVAQDTPAVQSGVQQARQARWTPSLLIVPGVAWEGAAFGDEGSRSHSEPGMTLGALFWAPLSRSAAFAFEGSFQPNRLENSWFDEGFRTLYLLVGPQFGRIGRNAYVRPSIGLALQSWSGAAVAPYHGTSPVLGLAVGSERLLGRTYRVSPEFVLRVSANVGLATWLAGFQVPLGVATAR